MNRFLVCVSCLDNWDEFTDFGFPFFCAMSADFAISNNWDFSSSDLQLEE